MSHQHFFRLEPLLSGRGYHARCDCGVYLAMPKITLDGPGSQPTTQPNADLGDAINYAKDDPSGLVASVRWFVGFFIALFKRNAPKP